MSEEVSAAGSLRCEACSVVDMQEAGTCLSANQGGAADTIEEAGAGK